MTVQERIQASLLLSEMKNNKKEAAKLGLKDISRIERSDKSKIRNYPMK